MNQYIGDYISTRWSHTSYIEYKRGVINILSHANINIDWSKSPINNKPLEIDWCKKLDID